MVKLTYCLRRKPGMRLEEFQRYWRDTHAPLVAESAEALGIRRYVQVHTSDLPEVHAMLGEMVVRQSHSTGGRAVV